MNSVVQLGSKRAEESDGGFLSTRLAHFGRQSFTGTFIIQHGQLEPVRSDN